MQSEWLLAILAAFGLGFVIGYLVRAIISRRRRRWSSWAYSRERRQAVQARPFTQAAQHRSQTNDVAPGVNTDPLQCPADAPSLSAPDFASEVEADRKPVGDSAEGKDTNQKSPIPLRSRQK
jgi:hypothetical protein